MGCLRKEQWPVLSRDGGCPDGASMVLGSRVARWMNVKDGMSMRAGKEKGGNSGLLGGDGPGKESGMLGEKAGFWGKIAELVFCT